MAAIVNNSSIYGLVGVAMQSIYAASKHGVLGLTKAAAIEYAKQGIRINAVCPGDIETPTVQRVVGDAEAMQRYAKANLLGRWGQPENIAEAVVWLCSDRAAWIIGQSLPVDGGYTIQ